MVMGAVKYKDRGVRRTLRCLAICSAVARPADDGLHPIQFRPICLRHPTGDARSNSSAPFVRYSPRTRRHRSRRSRTSKGWESDRYFITHGAPVPYFHVVFTLPAEIADIAYQNKAVIYDLLLPRLRRSPSPPIRSTSAPRSVSRQCFIPGARR